MKIFSQHVVVFTDDFTSIGHGAGVKVLGATEYRLLSAVRKRELNLIKGHKPHSLLCGFPALFFRCGTA